MGTTDVDEAYRGLLCIEKRACEVSNSLLRVKEIIRSYTLLMLQNGSDIGDTRGGACREMTRALEGLMYAAGHVRNRTTELLQQGVEIESLTFPYREARGRSKANTNTLAHFRDAIAEFEDGCAAAYKFVDGTCQSEGEETIWLFSVETEFPLQLRELENAWGRLSAYLRDVMLSAQALYEVRSQPIELL